MHRKTLVVLLLSSFVLPIFLISFTFAHEIVIPKTLSALTIFWTFIPFFLFYLHKRGRVDLPLFLPFFLLFLTFFISGFSFAEFSSQVVDREDYLVYLYIFVIVYITFLAVYNLKLTSQEKRAFLVIIFCLSVMEALIGLLQYKGLGEVFPYFNIGTTRVSGTFGYSNYLGFFLSLGIISAFYLWLEYEEWFKKERGVRGWAFLFIVGFVFAILNITGSRAGIVEALAGLFVFLFLIYRYLGKAWLWEKRRFIFYFLTVIVSATVIINFSSKATAVREFSGSVVTNAPSSSGDRAVMWLSAVDMYKDYPLTGVGLGNFSNHLSTYMADVLEAHPVDFLKNSATFHLHTHNDYLEILSETGILGFIALSVFCLILFSRCKIFLNRSEDEEKDMNHNKLHKLALVSLTVPFLLDAMISLTLHYFLFLILLAMILAQVLPKEGERYIPFGNGAFKAALIVVSVLSVMNLLTIWDVGRADINLEKGFKTREMGYLYKAMENPFIGSKTTPFYSQLLFWEGEAQANKKRMVEGINVMEEYYSFQPSAQVAHNMGQYYLSLGDKRKAIEWWEKGLSFQPNYRPILLSIANLSAPKSKKRVNIFEALSKKINKSNLKVKK